MSSPGIDERLLKEESLESAAISPINRKRSKSFWRWLIILLIALMVVIGLAVGLDVGLTMGRNDDNRNDDTSSSNDTLNNQSSANFTNNSSSSYWQPTAGTTWNYVLLHALNSTDTNSISAWGIDLFDNSVDTITGLQSNGAKVISYFSAGSYEDWRPDAANFTSTDLGSDLQGWKGEKWLNIRSPNVHSIMEARLDLAVQKHCNGIDPDNVDADSIAYMEFLANAAHDRNLAIGLKNAGDILPNVIDGMQWSVNEQCTQFQECNTYTPFIQQNKPVFHVEYPKGDNTNNGDNVDASTFTKYCTDNNATGFSTIIKNIDLDSWIQTC